LLSIMAARLCWHGPISPQDKGKTEAAVLKQCCALRVSL